MVRIILLFLFLTGARAQNSLIVADAQTREPLSFAIIRQGNAGVYSDANGRFETKSFLPGQSVEISMLGYETRLLEKSTSTDTIFMKPAIIPLPEVVIAQGLKSLKFSPGRHTRMFGDWPLTPSNEIFISLVSTLVERKLMRLEIPFSKSFEKSDDQREGQAMVRLNIYEGTEGRIDRKVFATEPIAINKIGKDVIGIDLTGAEVYLGPSGLSIGLEMLGYLNSDGSLTEHESYVRPRLTGQKIKNVQATTYLRNVLNQSGPKPITDILNLSPPSGMVIPERNLAIGLVLK